MPQAYTQDEPSRNSVDAMRGAVLLEFGDNYCGYCRAAQPAIEQALQARPEVVHLKIADGRGRPLGRSFSVKLWPTLVFLKDGQEVDRLVRPTEPERIAEALRALS
jgi:thioredoxin 1